MARGGPIRALVPALLVGIVWFAAAGAALAVQPEELLSDKAKEARARRISSEIRCLVCQNQSIDDSDAPLAHDLRVLVRERLVAGDTDVEVRDFIVRRYGTFVLLRPPLTPETLLLWLAPALVVAGAVLGLVLAARRRAVPGPAPLTCEEEMRLAALMAPGAADDGRGPHAPGAERRPAT